MGDGIGGPVLRCLSGNTFEMSVTHFRKDNAIQYDNVERIEIAKVGRSAEPPVFAAHVSRSGAGPEGKVCDV